jgi:uncharacterized protein YeaO (DUF488 family)
VDRRRCRAWRSVDRLEENHRRPSLQQLASAVGTRREIVVMSGTKVRVGRVYEEFPADLEGCRVLVDRLWPRGLTKARAHLDEWCKQVAPSTALRKWYGHDPERFAEFRRRYRDELGGPEQATAVTHLRELASHRGLTLLTASKDVALSEATVLAEVISQDP